MNYDLTRMFELLDETVPIIALNDSYRNKNTIRRSVHVPPDLAVQGDLFDAPETGGAADTWPLSDSDAAILAGLYSTNGLDLSALPENACRLFELSVNAFDAFVHAWMSELPIEAQAIRFGRKVLAAARQVPAATVQTERSEAARAAADRAASDRGDPDVRTILETSFKVGHEVHRLMGFLRFSPDEDAIYVAKCAPDYCILPALCEHFTQRFGDTPWVIIDEKRRLCLSHINGKTAFFGGGKAPLPVDKGQANWEKLWQLYHKTINNESRNNPGLQRRFMPKRYWKYITEL